MTTLPPFQTQPCCSVLSVLPVPIMGHSPGHFEPTPVLGNVLILLQQGLQNLLGR